MTGINAIYDIETRYQHFRETLTESAQQVLPEVERTVRTEMDDCTNTTEDEAEATR